MMVNRNLLSSKLAELADRVARIRSLGKLSEEELTANRDAFDLASFAIHCQHSGDCAHPPARTSSATHAAELGTWSAVFRAGGAAQLQLACTSAARQ